MTCAGGATCSAPRCPTSPIPASRKVSPLRRLRIVGVWRVVLLSLVTTGERATPRSVECSPGAGGGIMRRREFIPLIGGAAVWPLAARAQQSAMSVIGMLWPGQTPPGSPRIESFTQALRQLGFTEGQNVAIELRYARGGPQQLAELAAELVRLKVDVLVTFGDLTPKVAQQ